MYYYNYTFHARLFLFQFFELPRRLATVLPTTYSYTFLRCRKDVAMRHHSGFPSHPFRHWKVFATAAPRRACIHVSECISGLSLSRPVQIIALLSNYLNNKLICRSPILQRCKQLWMKRHSSHNHLWSIVRSFPRLSSIEGQVLAKF